MTVLMVMILFMYLFTPRIALADECPAGGDHEYTVTILRPATETEDGLRQYVCTKCGYTFTNTIPATGHQWSDWMVETAPTCTSEGLEYRVCTRYPDNPHYEYQIIPPLSSNFEHSYVETSRVEPTCTESGSVTYVCSVCGDTYVEVLPALGHDWGEWVVDTEPTQTSTGSEHRVCSRDPSHIEYQEIPAIVVQDDSAVQDSKPEADMAPEPQTDEPEPAAESHPTAFFTLASNNLDKALTVANTGVVLVWLGISAPLFAPILWIKRKKKEAQKQYQDEKANASEDDDRGPEL